MILLHTMRGLTPADMDCFLDHGNRRRCTEPRRPGSFYDSDVMKRIVAGHEDHFDPRPCGHYAAIDEGDHITVGEDSWEGNQAVADLFEWGYKTRVLTPELAKEIFEANRAQDGYDDDLINWVETHIGDEIFCVHW